MRRFIRQTVLLLVLSVGLLARRHNNTGSGDAGNTRTQVDTTATGGQTTVTGILDYAGGQWHRGRVRESRQDPSQTPNDRDEAKNDRSWAQQPTQYQPNYGDLDEHGRATGISITFNNDVRMDTKHDTAPTSRQGVPPDNDANWHQKGHLLGAQFGGSNNDARNFVPLYNSVNSPTMRRVENQVAAYMRAHPNEDVTYSVTPNYPANSSSGIPDSVTIEFKDSNGNPIQLEHPKGTTGHPVTIQNTPPPGYTPPASGSGTP
jgi:hypothetical protein